MRANTDREAAASDEGAYGFLWLAIRSLNRSSACPLFDRGVEHRISAVPSAAVALVERSHAPT
jgi:hypothetical protein